MPPPDLVLGFLVAAFCGAVVGVEREHGKGESTNQDLTQDDRPQPARNPAGVRTHVVAALLGALARTADAALDCTPAFAVATLGVATVFVTAAYAVRAVRTGHYGTTTVLTLLATYLLGVLALAEHRTLAAATAVVLAGVLAIKVPLHGFIWRLERREIGAALKLCLVALVLLPLLPDRSFGPLDWPWLASRLLDMGLTEPQMQELAVFNPWKLWLLVVLISGMGFGGYVLVRSLGAEKGLPLLGLVGGLVSSTAVTLSMAHQSKETPGVRDPFVAAVLAACTVMAARVLVLVSAFGPAFLPYVALPMGLMLISGGLVAWRKARTGAPAQAQAQQEAKQEVELRTPFALGPALRLTLLFFGILVLSQVMTLWLGGVGLLATAFFSGIVDVDAVTAAIAQQVDAGAPGFATAAIFTAVATNTVVKAGMMVTAGSRAAGRSTAMWLGVTLLAGGLGVAAVFLLV